MLFLHFQSPARHPKRLLQSHSSEASGHWGRPSQTSNPITHPEPSAHSKSPDWQTNSIKYYCLLVFYFQRNNQVQPDQLNKWAQKTFQEQVVTYIPQSISSDPSWQSLTPSQRHLCDTHTPSSHCHWFLLQPPWTPETITAGTHFTGFSHIWSIWWLNTLYNLDTFCRSNENVKQTRYKNILICGRLYSFLPAILKDMLLWYLINHCWILSWVKTIIIEEPWMYENWTSWQQSLCSKQLWNNSAKISNLSY